MYEGDDALSLPSVRLPLEPGPMPVLIRYRVTLDFTLCGLVGREVFLIEDFEAEGAERNAWSHLADSAIEELGFVGFMPRDSRVEALGNALQFWVNESRRRRD